MLALSGIFKFSAKNITLLFVLPFYTPCSARYSMLHLLVVLSGGNEPPLCKGRWLAQARRRDCNKADIIVKQSLSCLRRQLSLWLGHARVLTPQCGVIHCARNASRPLHKGAFGLRASKVHLLFLTSTAFVGTNATKVICFAFAQRDITRFTRSDIAPDGRRDSIFVLKIQRAKRLSRPKDISRTCAYHSPQANITGVPALRQVRQAVPFLF